MKKTINKYIFYEFSRYFTTTLFALSAVVWTVQAVNYLDLVTDDGHAFTVYFLYSLLTLSKVLTKLIPFSFLIATILTILKMEKDNELIILWTSGLNKIFVANHFFRISLIIMLIQLVLTAGINPTLLNISRSLLKNSELKFVSYLFKEKIFNDTVEGLTIFVDKKTEENIYKNIFIRDESETLTSVGTRSSTIFAKSGYVSFNQEDLILLNGNIQKLDSEGNVSIVAFEQTSFNLSGIATKSISLPKMQETPTINILKCMIIRSDRAVTDVVNTHNCNNTKKTKMDIKIEINKRFGTPFLIPLISLVCCFLLASRRDNKMYTFNKYIYFFIGFIIVALGEVAVRYSGISWNHTIFFYLVPILSSPIIYFILIKKFKYENLA